MGRKRRLPVSNGAILAARKSRARRKISLYSQVLQMNTEQDKILEDRPVEHKDVEAIDNAFLQLEVLYRTRCVQSPFGRNVTVRQVEDEEQD